MIDKKIKSNNSNNMNTFTTFFARLLLKYPPIVESNSTVKARVVYRHGDHSVHGRQFQKQNNWRKRNLYRKGMWSVRSCLGAGAVTPSTVPTGWRRGSLRVWFRLGSGGFEGCCHGKQLVTFWLVAKGGIVRIAKSSIVQQVKNTGTLLQEGTSKMNQR